MRLKSRVARLEKEIRGLRCAWCAFSLFDVAPPLPFLPRSERPQLLIYACCWRCGSRFTVAGDSIRERQVNALFYATNPAETYTSERGRAVFAYIIRLYLLHRKQAANGEEEEESEHQKSYGRGARREAPKVILGKKAKERLTARQRAEAEARGEHERLRKRLGDAPRDMEGKTFAELETIIFGDASPEAGELDAQWIASGASERV
ncbi:MAG: hypothetical protein M3362_02115 [Acidobacteriota bacterium]|nr:hypothetical protein [Acidobacteriota bacterium]